MTRQQIILQMMNDHFVETDIVLEISLSFQ
jgi:hypothetical protein